ncbi:MAG: hypothetical protein M3O46_04160, partial [Myxococcota bacterium]|nr:hypothetical protein [Myxococcota bacterium]
AAGTQACKSGHGRIWGLDFLQPVDSTTRKLGGIARLVPPPAGHSQYIQPDDPVTGDPSLIGVVIPGVSIKASPACAGLGNPSSDAYVAGAMHQTPANFSPGQFSVFTQMGTKGTGTQATKQFELQVPTPVAPTVIDSWAAVLE